MLHHDIPNFEIKKKTKIYQIYKCKCFLSKKKLKKQMFHF